MVFECRATTVGFVADGPTQIFAVLDTDAAEDFSLSRHVKNNIFPVLMVSGKNV